MSTLALAKVAIDKATTTIRDLAAANAKLAELLEGTTKERNAAVAQRNEALTVLDKCLSNKTESETASESETESESGSDDDDGDFEKVGELEEVLNELTELETAVAMFESVTVSRDAGSDETVAPKAESATATKPEPAAAPKAEVPKAEPAATKPEPAAVPKAEPAATKPVAVPTGALAFGMSAPPPPQCSLAALGIKSGDIDYFRYLIVFDVGGARKKHLRGEWLASHNTLGRKFADDTDRWADLAEYVWRNCMDSEMRWSYLRMFNGQCAPRTRRRRDLTPLPFLNCVEWSRTELAPEAES